MKRALQLAGIFALLSAAVCFLALAKAAADFSDTLAETDRAINSISQDVHTTALSVQYRMDSLDPIIAKAGRSLDSLDSAIKTHRTATIRASDELHGTFQNANAILLQAGLTSDELRRASIEQRAGLLESNQKLTAALDEARALLADIRTAVNDPAIRGTMADIHSSTTQINEAIYEMRHPPKKTRGQKVLGFILNLILSNAVQGAVRR